MHQPNFKPLLLPTLTDLQPDPQELVRIEKSLQSIGFFSAGKATDSSTRTVEQVIKQRDGKRVHARAIITAPKELGLPTTADRDKYMAFMKLLFSRLERDGELTNPVRFSGYELLKILRLSFAGYHYDEINDWLRRMTATTIMSESIIFLANRKEYATDIFHVFDQVTLHGQERADGTRSEEYEVYLSRWQHQNIHAGFLLKMDLNAYLELRCDISKALFSHLHIWFYASRGRPVEKRYPQFCQLLHIKQWPHRSKAKQILSRSMEELQKIGYIAEWDLVLDQATGDFKVTLSVGSRLLATSALSGIALPPKSLSDSIPWIAPLVQRGVVESVARQLALNIPDEQPVEDQIEYIDHLIASAPPGKLRNPPGLYVTLLRDNIAIPPSFIGPSQQRRKQQALQDSSSATAQLELDYDSYRLQLIEQHVRDNYSESQLDSEIAQRVKTTRKAYPNLPTATYREIAYGLFLRQIEENMNLPSFEQFARRNRQLPLPGIRSSL